MNNLKEVLNYIRKSKEIITIDNLKTLVDFNALTEKELIEIFRAIIKHNDDVIKTRRSEIKHSQKSCEIIKFEGFEKDNDKKENPITPTIDIEISKFIATLNDAKSEAEMLSLLERIHNENNPSQIISKLLLHLFNEKAAAISLLHNVDNSEEQEILRDEITIIDTKIAMIQTYNIGTLEEESQLPVYNKIALLRLPSGNIALLSDVESFKNAFYNEPAYYQDLIDLLEAVKTGNFLSPKKLVAIDSYEDRRHQLRLSFNYNNGAIVITSLFIKKSQCDAGCYSTLKSRIKLYQRVQNNIEANDEDLEILDQIIADLKAAISKRRSQ